MSDVNILLAALNWPRKHVFPFLDLARSIVQNISFQEVTRPAWAGFKTAEEGIAIIMSYIL